ncbi:MAG: arginine decarboxylase, partial [bacterium]
MAWTIEDSAELYGIPFWGKDLFEVNKAGHLVMTPAGVDKGRVDLHDVVMELTERGVELPVL